MRVTSAACCCLSTFFLQSNVLVIWVLQVPQDLLLNSIIGHPVDFYQHQLYILALHPDCFAHWEIWGSRKKKEKKKRQMPPRFERLEETPHFWLMDEDYRTFILRCQSNDQQWNATPAFSVCPGAGPKSERFPFGDKILTQSSLNSHKSETETATAHSGSRNASLLLRKTSDSVHLCGNNNNKHWSEHMIGTSALSRQSKFLPDGHVYLHAANTCRV